MLGAIILIAFTQPDILTATPASDDHKPGFPEDVVKILETIFELREIVINSLFLFSKYFFGLIPKVSSII